MLIGVLGPLQVGSDGNALGRRDRVVLAVLAASPGRVISADTLVDAIWGDHPPVSAAKVVQGCVSRLRKLLGAEAIRTDPRGYVLDVPEEHIDLHRFVRLVERARELVSLGEHDRAVYALDEGLDLWRGRALVDIECWPAGQARAAQAEELRQDADELRLDALLRSGKTEEALAAAPTLVRAAPMRERRWALMALAQYQAGRQAEALSAVKQARGVLVRELGLDPGPELADLEQRILAHDPSLIPTTPAQPQVDHRCPYRGLAAYEVDDAEGFFGRTTDRRVCLRVLREHGVLVVAGPSGVGKSSLVRAGVAAALRSQGVAVQIVTPARNPLQAVAWDQLPRRTVLVVDQAEELFSLSEDEERDAFIARVVERSEMASVVLALRSDALTDVGRYPGLARLVEKGLFLLGPMDPADLRAAIEEPARQHGLRLEPGLVDLLLRDVEAEPGALPLLSHALQETWKRREGVTLTVAGYQATGGIRGAVTQSAEALYARLDESERHLLRELLLRLVSSGPEGEPVRARLPRRIVVADEAQAELVDALVGARLVTLEEGALQIAHESLGRAWPRLRTWLDDDAEGRLILHHLAGTADAWDSLGRPGGELYRGTRLAYALEWRNRTDHQLTVIEREFLDASSDGARAERRAEADRLGARAAAVADPDLALLLAVEAVQHDDNAETRGHLRKALARRPELVATTDAVSQPLINVATNPADRTRVAAYGLGSGIWLFDSDSGQVVAHHDLLGRDDVRGNDGATAPMQFTDDGLVLVAGCQFYTEGPHIYFLDAQTLEAIDVPLAMLPRRRAKVASVDVRSHYLAVAFAYLGSIDRLDADIVDTDVHVWDLDHPEAAPVVIPRGRRPFGQLETAQISPDGCYVYTSNPATKIRVSDGEVIWRKPDVASHLRVTLSEDGRWLAASGMKDARVLEARGGHVVMELPPQGGRDFAFSEDRMAALGSLGVVRVYEWPSQREIATMRSDWPGGLAIGDDRIYTAPWSKPQLRTWDISGREHLIARRDLKLSNVGEHGAWNRISPNGRIVASLHRAPVGDRHVVELIDLETDNRAAVLVGEDGGYATGAWRGDGAEYATGDVGGTITVTDTKGNERRSRIFDAPVAALDYAEDRLVVATADGLLSLVDLSRGKLDGPPVRLPGTDPLWITVSPDSGQVIVLASFGDTATGEFRSGAQWSLVDLHRRTVIRTGRLDAEVWWGATEWSPTGDRVAFVGGTGALLMDPTSGRMVSRPAPAQDGAWTAAWAPDGSVLASGGDDGTVARWDGRSGALLDVTPIADADTPISYVQLVPWICGPTMMAADSRGTLYRWDTRSEVMVDAARRMAGRTMTGAERETYLANRAPQGSPRPARAAVGDAVRAGTGRAHDNP